MAFTDYRMIRAPIKDIEGFLKPLLVAGWQPFGGPIQEFPGSGMVFQAMVLGTADGGAGAVTPEAVLAALPTGTNGQVLKYVDGQWKAAADTDTNTTYQPATTTADGLMSSTDKVKLNEIAAQATKNDTDTNLKDRANHTGTQAMGTIEGLTAALADKAAASALAEKADLSAHQSLESRVAALEAAATP